MYAHSPCACSEPSASAHVAASFSPWRAEQWYPDPASWDLREHTSLGSGARLAGHEGPHTLARAEETWQRSSLLAHWARARDASGAKQPWLLQPSRLLQPICSCKQSFMGLRWLVLNPAFKCSGDFLANAGLSHLENRLFCISCGPVHSS